MRAISAPQDHTTEAHPPTKPLGDKKVDDTSRKGSEVVDTDDDAFETTVWMTKGVQPILIAHNSGKDTLVIAEEDKCQLQSVNKSPS